MSITTRGKGGNTPSGDSQSDGPYGTPAMSPLKRTDRDGRSNLSPKFYIQSNDPDNMGDPEGPKLNIYSTAGRFSKGTPPPAGTFDTIDLITYLRRHIDNFIGQDSPSNPDLKTKGISIRNIEPTTSEQGYL